MLAALTIKGKLFWLIAHQYHPLLTIDTIPESRLPLDKWAKA
jgi:hypothetical protein